MSVIALLNYEESVLRIYQKSNTVSIISEQPSYMQCKHHIQQESNNKHHILSIGLPNTKKQMKQRFE